MLSNIESLIFFLPIHHHQESLSVVLMPPVFQEPTLSSEYSRLSLTVIDSDYLKSVLPDVFSPTFPRRSLQAPGVSVYGDEAISKHQENP